MRQNQTINPFPQSRQIGKGGGILNTLYEIGYWNKIAISVRNEYILSLTFKTSEVTGIGPHSALSPRCWNSCC